MNTKSIMRSRRVIQKPPPFYVVLACLIALMLVGSIVSQLGVSSGGRVLNLVGLVVPVLAVAAASGKPRLRGVVLALSVVCAMGNADGLWNPVGLARVPSIVMSLALLAITTFVMFAAVLQSRNATGDVIAGAVATYLLVGVSWAIAYGLVESIWPGSISLSGVPDNAGQMNWTTLLYFSFITLMTIGYGDIVPVHPLSRGLAIFEGLAGIGFTTIFLAFLVAARVSSMPRSSGGEREQ
jgi:hypothetical protein